MMSSSSSARQNNFNFLRLFLALLVLLSHSPELVDGNPNRELLFRMFGTVTFGQLAVDGFFLLSGYLIVQSWHLNPQIGLFLKKRMLRIYPGFIIASLISGLVVGPLGSDAAKYFSDFWISGFVKGMALLQMPVTPPAFVGRPHPHVNGSMWTISLEFTCYLLVAVLGVAKVVKRRHLLLGITVGIFAMLIAQKLGTALPFLRTTWHNELLRLSSFFFAGGCFFLYKERIKFTRRTAFVAAVILFAAMFSLNAAELALATLGAYLLFYVAFTPIRMIAAFSNPHVPDVSYGVYLYGWPIQKLLLWYFPTMSPWPHFMLATSICLFLGVVSWYTVEKPFMKLKSPAPPYRPVAPRLP
jgi:peptidoglycan/LPS O-acetylase OafA/YrhL